MVKNKLGLLGLLGIPLAAVGIVGSAVFAQSTSSSPATPNTPAAQVQAVAGITADQAKAAVEAKIGGTAASVALDDDQVNGHAAYEVKINGQEVKVDGLSGAIISTEHDDGDAGTQDANEAPGTETND